MTIKKKPKNRKFEIDLTGSQGNVFFLMGQAQKWGKQLNLNVDSITNDMMSGDYEHAIEVFDKHFGSFCDLLR